LLEDVQYLEVALLEDVQHLEETALLEEGDPELPEAVDCTMSNPGIHRKQLPISILISQHLTPIPLLVLTPIPTMELPLLVSTGHLGQLAVVDDQTECLIIDHRVVVVVGLMLERKLNCC